MHPVIPAVEQQAEATSLGSVSFEGVRSIQCRVTRTPGSLLFGRQHSVHDRLIHESRELPTNGIVR